MCLGFDEVVAPDVIAPLRPETDAGPVIEPQTASRLMFLRYFQPLAAPDTLHTVGSNTPTCILEQLGDPAIAIAAIFRCERNDRSCQRIFVRTDNPCITLCTTWLADEPAGVTFREPILLPNPLDRLPTPFGAYKFPEAISFRTCFSSDRSATRRLSRVFSGRDFPQPQRPDNRYGERGSGRGRGGCRLEPRAARKTRGSFGSMLAFSSYRPVRSFLKVTKVFVGNIKINTK